MLLTCEETKSKANPTEPSARLCGFMLATLMSERFLSLKSSRARLISCFTKDSRIENLLLFSAKSVAAGLIERRWNGVHSSSLKF